VNSPQHSFDLVIVGAGAAGLAAAIFAAETAAGRDLRILMIEGAAKPGAKILVSGGGRCNVTNENVTPVDFCGGSRAIIRNVLAQFNDQKVREWFGSIGVPLKLEPTGKYFPVSDEAKSVLAALLARVDELGIRMWAGTRVTEIAKSDSGFSLTLSDTQVIESQRVIIATGGLALPKSGSDGAGMKIMEKLGHTIVPTTQALTPLLLSHGRGIGGRFTEFSGVTIEARMRLFRAGHGKALVDLTGSLLFTHLGLSGPVAMNFSRHWLRERLENPEVALEVTISHPDFTDIGDARKWLSDCIKRAPSSWISSALTRLFPDRIADAMIQESGVTTNLSQMTAKQRDDIAVMVSGMRVDVIGARDYNFAEATAGGVELSEIDYHTMESRKVPGLYLCGEILDVDGRIGGFNFQWAWSSGYVAGRAAVVGMRD
jgi:predicted Rossmann fold flavoprotein